MRSILIVDAEINGIGIVRLDVLRIIEIFGKKVIQVIPMAGDDRLAEARFGVHGLQHEPPFRTIAASAIALGQWQSLEQTPGVGKKLAQRITMELKDKAPALSVAGMHGPAGTSSLGYAPPEGNAAAEAISALTNLGYNPAQASAAVAVASNDLGKDADTAKLIRRGLKELAK